MPYFLRQLHLVSVVSLALAAGACEPGDSTDTVAAALTSPPIDVGKELLITHLSVVEDSKRAKWTGGGGSDGVWSVSRLMYWASGKVDPSRFILRWLREWEMEQVVNGRPSAARPEIRRLVIDPWLKASGCAVCATAGSCAAVDDACKLDYTKEPFRLLAIVNRIDLRNISNVAKRNAGEGRLVFGVLGLDEATGQQTRVLQYTVIFEYEMPGVDPPKVREWGRNWHQLSEKAWGNDYNNALTSMTDKWTRDNCKSKPNSSCLNQIRTNEASLDPGKLWELREFRIDAASRALEQTTLVQTPHQGWKGTEDLGAFVNANESAILGGTYRVPAELLAPDEPTPPGLFWNAPNIANPQARHQFGLTTCGGCHTDETATRFTHVKPRAAGVEAKLSAFLTGIDPTTLLPATAPDPVTGEARTFNDLARRVEDLRFVLSATDAQLGGKPPANAPH